MFSRLFRMSLDLDGDSSQSTSGNSSLDGLPSSRFRHTNWSDLPSTAEAIQDTGDRLKAPRIRQAPLPGDACFEPRPVEARPLPHDVRVTSDEAVNVRLLNEELSFAENWEEAIEVNLSYQNLGDPYQQANFKRIMKRLSRCQRLHLINNHLTSLNSFTLPMCVHLVLTKNCLESFKQLPKMPLVQHITLTENAIKSLDGLSSLFGQSQLTSLKLHGNPVIFILDYRKRVFAAVPSLISLDGIQRRLCDDGPPQGDAEDADGSGGGGESGAADGAADNRHCIVS